MTTPEPPPPLPPEPHESLARAERLSMAGNNPAAIVCALTAIATELGAIRRELRKGR